MCWSACNFCRYLNSHHTYLYKKMHGDKGVCLVACGRTCGLAGLGWEGRERGEGEGGGGELHMRPCSDMQCCGWTGVAGGFAASAGSCFSKANSLEVQPAAGCAPLSPPPPPISWQSMPISPRTTVPLHPNPHAHTVPAWCTACAHPPTHSFRPPPSLHLGSASACPSIVTSGTTLPPELRPLDRLRQTLLSLPSSWLAK